MSFAAFSGEGQYPTIVLPTLSGRSVIMLVDQAVFTSVRTDRRAGYQLAAVSSGITETEARDLSAWGPTHDSLFDPTPTGRSLNFHLLSTGRYAVSWTAPTGVEYSGRSGPCISTQFFIAAPEALELLGNNPFCMLERLLEAGHLRLPVPLPPRLTAIQLSARPAPSVASLVRKSVEDWGAWELATLVHQAMHENAVALHASAAPEPLLATLLYLVPAAIRPAMTFVTGLRASASRPVRLFVLPPEPVEQRRVIRQTRAAIWQPDKLRGTRPVGLCSWAEMLGTALMDHRTVELCDFIAQPRPWATVAGLDLLAAEFLGKGAAVG